MKDKDNSDLDEDDDEFASNHKMNIKTGEYLGNFVKVNGRTEHFSFDSFCMWLKKLDIKEIQFESQGEKHFIEVSRILRS